MTVDWKKSLLHLAVITGGTWFATHYPEYFQYILIATAGTNGSLPSPVAKSGAL